MEGQEEGQRPQAGALTAGSTPVPPLPCVRTVDDCPSCSTSCVAPEMPAIVCDASDALCSARASAPAGEKPGERSAAAAVYAVAAAEGLTLERGSGAAGFRNVQHEGGTYRVVFMKRGIGYFCSERFATAEDAALFSARWERDHVPEAPHASARTVNAPVAALTAKVPVAAHATKAPEGPPPPVRRSVRGAEAAAGPSDGGPSDAGLVVAKAPAAVKRRNSYTQGTLEKFIVSCGGRASLVTDWYALIVWWYSSGSSSITRIRRK